MDIKKPDLSVVLEKLSFLKNNLALLVPIVLVVVAALLFIPTTLFSKSLQSKVQKGSLTAGGDKCDRLLQNGVVPKEQFEVQRKNLTGLAHDANEIKLWNEQSVQRSLLSYRIFPIATDTASQKYEDFGKAFCNGILTMIQETPGTVPPTPEELGYEGGAMGGAGGGPGGGAGAAYGGGMYDMQMMMGRGGRGGARDGAGRGDGMMEDFTKQARDIEDAICLDKAIAGSVYITPLDIVGYEHWSIYVYNTGRDEAIKSCWYWQHGYWIVEDIFQTLAQCNQGSNTVPSSPVKRLLALRYEQDMSGGMGGVMGGRGGMEGYGGAMMGRGGLGGMQNKNMPRFLKSGSMALATPGSARYTNDEFNIIHFNVSVVVEASYQVAFMKALCSAKTHTFSGFKGDEPEQTFEHNQITILACQVKPVVRKDMTHNYYRYGEDAVVELSLTCEYLLPIKGYAVLIPEVLATSEEPASTL
jgi:hypothetical protein